MSSGGARNRSGPPPDPGSGRSERRGVSVTALPHKGWTGKPPPFPLPDELDREHEVWLEAWKTPQAAAWSLETWRWRTVAQWVRWSVRMEHAEASASLGNVVVRLADQIGLTPAGLRENGWAIAPADAPPAAKKAAAAKKTAPKRRLRAAPADGGH